jgi:hypothetical protein
MEGSVSALNREGELNLQVGIKLFILEQTLYKFIKC